MKEYTFLSDKNKARNISLLLICVSSFLMLINLYFKNRWIQCFGCILAIVFYCFAIHYLDYHNVKGQNIKKYIFIIHLFAIHALIYIFEGFTNAPGYLSYQFMHGLVDAFLVAGIVSLIKLEKPIITYGAVTVSLLVTFVLSLFNMNVILSIFIIFVSVALAYFAYGRKQITMLYGIFISLFSLLALISKKTPYTHRYLHLIAIFYTLLIAYYFYDIVISNEINRVELTRSNINLEPTRKRTTLFDDVEDDDDDESTVKVSKTRKTNTNRNISKTTSVKTTYKVDKSWFIKSYQDKTYKELLDAPIYAFKGVTKQMADDLKEAFNIKTVKDLADSKFFKWAKNITEEAKK